MVTTNGGSTVRPQTAGRARRYSTPGVAALAVSLVALAGCGSSSKSSSSSSTAASTASSTPASTAASTPAPSTSVGSTQPINLAASAEGQLKFDKRSLTAKPGSVTINFKNASPLAHNVTIASPSGSVVGETPTFQGGAKTLTVKLAAGTYKFYCSVPGHRAAGMEGTLTVH
jgi:plastocyanin